MKLTCFALATAVLLGCGCTDPSSKKVVVDHQAATVSTDSILKEHLVNGAWKLPLYSQERQFEIDKGLAKDSTIAYLWQQKSMPLFKQGKYELGMTYVDQAVKYDPDRWQDYRAFIKCIFAKTYRAAIDDFLACKARFGNRVVMDHSYNFYIGLSHLQLNEFEKAEAYFQEDYDSIVTTKGEGWLHHLDLFYSGVCAYELFKTEDALTFFDEALARYPQFSDAQYFKALCLKRLGEKEAATELIAAAKENAGRGYTINEDNEVYERYPYQVRWGR